MASELYCWPHRTLHTFTPGEVEQIVYALGAAEITQYDSGYRDHEDGIGRTRLPEDPPQCLKEVLRAAADAEVFGEHTEQGIECRKSIQRTRKGLCP